MFRRDNIKLIVVATVCLLVGLSAPAVGHGDPHAKFAHNAGKVDGRHAVGSNASINKRKGKLVATRPANGRLPNNIIVKAPDANRVDGINSPQLQFPSQVPPGRMVVGSWGFDVDTDGTGDWAGRVSYPAPMPVALQFHWVEAGAPAIAECPGDVDNPKAQAGHVCVYGFISGVGGNNPGPHGNSTFGFNLLVSDDGTAGDMYGQGTWAARAVSPPLASAEASTTARK